MGTQKPAETWKQFIRFADAVSRSSLNKGCDHGNPSRLTKDSKMYYASSLKVFQISNFYFTLKLRPMDPFGSSKRTFVPERGVREVTLSISCRYRFGSHQNLVWLWVSMDYQRYVLGWFRLYIYL